MRAMRKRRTWLSVTVSLLSAAAIVGCGSSSSSSSTSSSASSSAATSASSSAAAPAANAAVAALVPSAIKSKGTITVAADASYAPNEFIGSDGHTVVGMDADLANALFPVLGLKVKIVNATFDTIIPGLSSGKFDVGMSSFTDTKAREKVVNFVDYFKAGTSFFEKSSGGPKVTNLASLCGLSVSVETGTTEQSDADGQAKKCPSSKKLTVLPYSTQSAANLALSSGRAQVGMADSPVAAYQVKQSGGKFKLTGDTYGTSPYGIAVPKSDGTLDKAILAALKDLQKNGTYKKILSKWGISSGADNSPALNGALS
jgi:polar amino acid transport system substrate-binding protein